LLCYLFQLIGIGLIFNLDKKKTDEMYADMAAKLDELVISFEFSEPFAEDKQKNWSAISSLYQSGVCSLETAVTMLALSDAPEEEIAKIKEGQASKTPVKPEPSM
jgi:ribonucleotide reductase alpha subunit